ncbi:XVIPCD domain-containing protein [Xanthomonas campestris]|jgi:peptidoglycan hydrolase-like protein with peptidoglycan-binding domain|uniref:XVIPCD domain-containing protein n=1 Tax=Xanthomonas campestris TaxID=339 RepID=UPI000E329901|nr:XVIPCD domain-containing protein [Xanthomonas campestris]MEA9491035.1 XVIPCD domain-containing protein [Xanthomonas campestris]MEA9509527.1 XVIPCD domain-containing protein [Xanthomonas campestris]MEA9575969.1 XVIPCD domain-containing protein [Xanthomonas campestris]MEA9732175.1 XVIPCD domain-containing protein [Xanthomonas campestris]MEB2112631.1 XVIPCD domain-containing protein [Xanthomonas campestris pv. campestris]
MPKYTIVESVGRGVQHVHDFEDIERHHPTRGNERGRVYGTVNGEREELLGNYRGAATVSRDGDHYVSKDFVLQADGSSVVPVPAVASGYIGRVDRSDGIVQIYDKPASDASREMIAQYRHLDLRNTQLEPGARIEYGQPIGIQGGFNNGNPSAFGKHVHVDINTSYLPQAERYVRDLDSGVITTDQHPQTAQPNLTGQALVAELSSSGRTVATAASAASAAATADGVLRKDEHGPAVKALQERLNQLGYTDAHGQPLGTDGKFGDRTKQAVEAFQRDHHLEADGIAGRHTLDGLKTAHTRQPEHSAPVAAESASRHSAAHGAPLLSDQAHPQHVMYQQAVGALEKLGPSAGFKNRTELEQAAGTLTHDASISGLTRIDHVVASKNGQGLFGVEGKLDDPSHRRVFVDREQASHQSLEQSTQKLRQDLPAAEQEPTREPARAMSM